MAFLPVTAYGGTFGFFIVALKSGLPDEQA